jgi:hypothetical protein
MYSLTAFVLAAATPLYAGQEAKVPAPKEPARLTEEQKEILKHRKILENMELLQNLDKCRLFDLFAENSDGRKDSAEPAPEKEKQKKK